MTYKLLDEQAGYPMIDQAVAVPTNLRGLPVPPGFLARAQDPVWGTGEFVFARAGAGIRQFGLCVLTPAWDSTTRSYLQNMSEVPNTANLGRAVYVAMSVLTTGQYGWFMRTGVTPINGTASVAADTTFGITAAGQVGANSAGKQILGGRVIQAATATVAKVGRGDAGDFFIYVPDTDGLFLGGFLSGTGVGASAVIAAIDPLGSWIRASVANSAAVAGTVTQTANNATIFYNVCALDSPIAQGAIT